MVAKVKACAKKLAVSTMQCETPFVFFGGRGGGSMLPFVRFYLNHSHERFVVGCRVQWPIGQITERKSGFCLFLCVCVCAAKRPATHHISHRPAAVSGALFPLVRTSLVCDILIECAYSPVAVFSNRTQNSPAKRKKVYSGIYFSHKIKNQLKFVLCPAHFVRAVRTTLPSKRC